MIPASLVGLTLFVLAVAPGWVWVRVAEKRQVRPDRSPLLEAAELVVIGVIFTTVAAAVVAGFGNGNSWIPELRELTARGSTFAQEEPYRTAATAAMVFALSLAAAYGTARFVHRGKEASLVPAGSVWRDVFGEGGEGRPIFVSANLVDGRVVDGYLYSYSTDAGGADRDLGLQAPIYVWSGEPLERRRAPADRTVLRAEQIAAMWVRYEWDRDKTRRQANNTAIAPSERLST